MGLSSAIVAVQTGGSVSKAVRNVLRSEPLSKTSILYDIGSIALTFLDFLSSSTTVSTMCALRSRRCICIVQGVAPVIAVEYAGCSSGTSPD
jgi:hypothetical protein